METVLCLRHRLELEGGASEILSQNGNFEAARYATKRRGMEDRGTHRVETLELLLEVDIERLLGYKPDEVLLGGRTDGR